jgi:hypothetical protein
MRRLLVLLPLASCGGPPPLAAPETRIDCRPAGAAGFARTCTVEMAQAPRGIVFTLRKADGGFRRLVQTFDNQFAAADGAEPAHVVRLRDGRIEVEIGGDRFRFGTEWRVTLPPELQRP